MSRLVIVDAIIAARTVLRRILAPAVSAPPRPPPATRRPWSLAAVALVVTLVLANLPWAGPDTHTALAAPRAVTGLHVSGNQILNGDGQPLRLRGVNETSGEYACIQNFGIFNHSFTTTDAGSVQA